MSQFGTVEHVPQLHGLSVVRRVALSSRESWRIKVRLAIPLIAIALSACSSRGDEEAQKYAMVERQHGDVGMFRYRTLCTHSKAVAEAYLNEKNEMKFQEWRSKSDANCSRANDPYAR